jgi:esterase/lipase superfamily enzyme
MAHDTGKLTALVTKALVSWQFDELCFNHFPDVHEQFENQDRGRRVIMLVDYVQRQETQDELVDLIAGYAPKAALRYREETQTGADFKAPTQQPQAPTAQPLAGAASRRCDVLVMSASPQSQPPLELEQEAALIVERLREGESQVRVVVRHAVRVSELHRHLLEFDPRIVHLSGHGNRRGELLLLDAAGGEQPLSAETLAETFRALAGRVECVVLNACFSAERADALADVVRCVVGMSAEIDDESARRFAGGFYRGLAFGHDYRTAVGIGRVEIQQERLPDAQIPQFYTRDWRMHDPAEAVWGGSVRVKRHALESPDERAPVLQLWYGTNRRPLDASPASRGYGAERSDQVHYGTCEVQVPKSHRIGQLGSPAFWRWVTRTDDRVLLNPQSLSALPPDEFPKRLTARLLEVGVTERDVLVYLHGFNMSFEDAARRAAQISADIKFPGVTAFFSWPSLRKLAGYVADGETIRYSEPYIAEFFRQLIAAGPRKVHVIAHSMGNRGLLHALPAILSGANHPRPFDQLFLAAPDVDADIFRREAPRYAAAAAQTTLYASRKDWAVRLSSVVNWGERAGFHPPVTIVDGIDTVSVVHTDLDSFGHGYVADARVVLTDIQNAIAFGAPPAGRMGLDPRDDPDGGVYWQFRT